VATDGGRLPRYCVRETGNGEKEARDGGKGARDCGRCDGEWERG
jgi:hypothetical protein